MLKTTLLLCWYQSAFFVLSHPTTIKEALITPHTTAFSKKSTFHIRQTGLEPGFAGPKAYRRETSLKKKQRIQIYEYKIR